ncbi:MAG: Gfo/Idh/MocA family oxidoreductase [Capsulimonadaceae bacterium]|nr:Gfo/Idh/MocA family oxidoreductase [Capsulimonadaceae bacterium]
MPQVFSEEHLSVRYAIAGSGAIASVHANAIAATKGADLAAVWSRNAARADAFAAAFGCDHVAELDRLLARDDIDAIAITTPGGSHAEIAIAAAQAGKHVIVEKPLDVTVARADAIITACQACGVMLGAIFQYRFGAGALLAKRAVDQGRFGRLVQASAFVPWHRGPEYFDAAPWRGSKALSGGGALMNQAIHAVDLLLWLAGDAIEVSASMDLRVHRGIEVEDNLAAWMRFRCGALGLLQASTCCYPGESKRVELKGELGSVTLEDDMPVFWQFDGPVHDDDLEARRLREPPCIAEDVEANLGYNGARDPRAITVTGHQRQYEDFTRALTTGSPLFVSGREGRRAVAFIEAVYASAESGGKNVQVALDK